MPLSVTRDAYVTDQDATLIKFLTQALVCPVILFAQSVSQNLAVVFAKFFQDGSSPA
jgi:hypothetical protein